MMKISREMRNLIFALFVISLGGLLLHYRIHPLTKKVMNYIPFFFTALGVILTPILLGRKNTALYGYMINGFSVVVGTITMAAYSIISFKPPLTLFSITFLTLFPDILILFSKFFLGLEIMRHYYPQGTGRVFKTPWWIVHFVGPAIVFAAGFFLWR